MTVNEDVLSALERLRLAERERRDAISEFRSLGVIRSRGLVCDIGEAIAAAHYEVELSDASNPGYDLVTKDGKKVQVRTLRCTPRNHRTSIGVMKLLYDLLLALRINEDFEPLEAIEVFRGRSSSRARRAFDVYQRRSFLRSVHS